MVVSKKPKREEENISPSALSEEETEALIHKGGSVARAVSEPSRKISYISLRIPAPLLERIDQQVAHMTTPNRHAWLLEAAAERVKREEDG